MDDTGRIVSGDAGRIDSGDAGRIDSGADRPVSPISNLFIIFKLTTRLNYYKNDYSKFHEGELINNFQLLDWTDISDFDSDVNTKFDIFCNQIS